MSERVYQLAPRVGDQREMLAQDVGHRLWFVGIILQGEGQTTFAFLPSATFPPVVAYGTPTFTQLDAQGWADMLEASDDPKFLSDENKAWIRKCGRQVSNDVQQKIWARDQFRCVYCGRKMGDVHLTIDHFMPLEMGGKNDPSNYLSACRKCNKDKGSIPPRVFCEQRHLDFDALERYLKGGMNLYMLPHLRGIQGT
jgi:hypothetical protein